LTVATLIAHRDDPILLAQPASTAEARAVDFLAREVPRWKTENDCYSCHNNGDAARALLVAGAAGLKADEALDDTLAWLRRPTTWKDNKTQGGIDDKALARVQFAGALTIALDQRRAPRTAMREAASLLAADQKDDGSWQLDTSQSIGSPTTYGTTIATWLARRSLVAAADEQFASAIGRADQWLRATSVATVLDASAVVLGLDRSSDSAATAQRAKALDTIRRGQAQNGGWGPYVTSAPEVFDTALALLALNAVRQARLTPSTEADLDAMITRGRSFLLSQQVPDGSWPETTRPSNQESYAQRISTTGWALLAILETK
jgi:squalene cyclase